MSDSQQPPAAPTSLVYAHPWALHDQGLGPALDELHGCGIAGVRLALSYHVADHLTPRSPRGRHRVGDLGSLSFDPGSFSGWPFAPPVSARVTSGRFTADVVAAANVAGLKVGAWLVYCHNHALARSRPELAVVNAYGDRSGAHLCPANPAVRDYASALTASALEQGEFDGLYAESLSYLPFDHGWLNAKAAVAPGPTLRSLLSLCFCEHCRQAARASGLALERLQSVVRAASDELLNRLPDAGEEAVAVSEHPPGLGEDLAALADVRAGVVAGLQRDVAATAHSGGLRFASNLPEVAAQAVNGGATEAVLAWVDEVRVAVDPGSDAARLKEDVARIKTGARRAIAAVAFYQLERFVSQAQFTAALLAAREAGLQHHSFYEHSVMTQRHVAWLRGAQEVWKR